MRGLKSFVPVIVVVLLAVVWLLFISEGLAKWLTHATQRSTYNGAVVGRVVHAEGSVRVVHGSDITLVPSPVNKPVEFRDGDRVQTSVESKAVLILNSQDELSVPSSTVLQFQLWNPRDAKSPIYVQALIGQVGSLKAGVRGKAYVVKDGRLYLPGQKPTEKAMALTVLRSQPLDLHLAESGQNTPNAADFESDSAPANEDAPVTNASDPETLSNEYIDDTIVGHQPQLQKCWLSRLKDKPGLKGQIVLQFEISKRGLVKNVHVPDASITDDTLKKCVVSVFERIKFRSYKGSEISLSYPVSFE